MRNFLCDMSDAVAWVLFVLCFGAGAFGLCVVLGGCDTPNRYNPAQRDAIVAEEEAAAMNRLDARGRVSTGDWQVYNKRQEERLARLRREVGVK